ncbi:TolC family protein [Fibrella aquatilis]|uniref:TolC family protein n=1 Tax=Fibrella aquatilis TaxID=2817059 RepID=A0A939JYT6_9BACT|nr:TolC family protein [Fibrella aquatilis]MBO0930206.1 TolC family protein [Fibrella aquatilis]
MKRSTTFLLSLATLLTSAVAFGQSTTPPAVGVGLTRAALIEQALSRSYALATNQAEQTKVKIEQQSLRNQYLPEVTFNPTFTHLDRDIAITIPRLPYQPLPKEIYSGPYDLSQVIQRRDILRATVSANVLLFSGTKIPTLGKALVLKGKAVSAMADKERMAVIRDVAQAYDQLALVAKSETVLAEADTRLLAQTTFINRAVKEGLATPYDRSKVELAAQDLKAKHVDLDGKRQLAIARLTQLTGLPAAQLADIRPELTPLMADTLATGVDNRPEIKALTFSEQAANYKQKATIAGYLPQAYAFGKNELRRQDLSAIEPYWYVGVGIRWTLFDKMAARSERRTAQQDVLIAQNNLNQTRELLTLNLAKSRTEVATANQLLVVAQQKTTLARRALDIATKQYEQGLIRITERLEAESDFQKAELDYLQAIVNQRSTAIAQREATGDLTVGDVQ